MGRRSSGLGNLLNLMMESSLGRIRWTSNMWAIIGSQWDRKRLQNPNMAGKFSDRFNHLGEWDLNGLTLVRRKNTRCPQPPGDDFARLEKLFYVPATECQKCPLHVPPGRFRFPRCGFKFEDDAQAVLNAANDIKGVLDDATKMVNEIMQ